VPVHGSTLSTLGRYARTRDRLCPQTATASFFVSTAGTRLIYARVGQVFRRLRDRAGIGAGADRRPRIHDLRHYADGWVMCPAVAFPLLGAEEPALQSA
jgi:integrase/recombinase XerD